jgi:FKBP-type peptidyl-prolyl cis-trans isomerase FklB
MYMKKVLLFITLVTAGHAAIAQVKKAPVKPGAAAVKPAAKTTAATAMVFKNNTDSMSYAVGLRIAQSLKSQGLTSVNMSLFEKGMNDFRNNKSPLLNDDAIAACMGRFQQQMNEVRSKENEAKAAASRKEGADFLAANGKRNGVITLPSGLQYEVLKAGADNTQHPTLNSKVKCHYTGTLLNGTKFDSSVDRGEPITFPLSNVIRGWQEAVQLMTVGSKWKLFIPADLAYGDNAPPNIGPGATLIFEVELLGIEE